MNFTKLVEQILQENNVMGGPSSVMGSGVENTASVVSGDKYAPKDARMPKSLYGGIITRRGMTGYFKKNKKNKKK